MCTGFIKKGNDLIYGFNLDIDDSIWNYNIHKDDFLFSISIKVGKREYYTHGVNALGSISNLPYMNDFNKEVKKIKSSNKIRIDLLTDRYLRNIYSYNDVVDLLNKKELVDINNDLSMHSLISNENGDLIIAESNIGYKIIDKDYAVITNFPLLKEVNDDLAWYGKDRYNKVDSILCNSNDDFNVSDALKLLSEVTQDGPWSTKVSFVYSRNENTIYYALNKNYSNVMIHKLKRGKK